MKLNKLMPAMSGVCMMVATHSAFAAESVESSFNVKIAVSSLCKIDNINDVDFGTVSAAVEHDVIENTKLSIKCNELKPYTIALVPSNKNTTGQGEMTSADGNNIKYGLYSDSAATVPWGSTGLTSHTGNGRKQEYPVYVKVAGSEFDAPSGSYNDIVTVRVNY
ncbi:Csu type fimbrial protein [Enterobacter asburiae]|nr:spore coat U domain-containing protein [Enterobacter asburiae]